MLIIVINGVKNVIRLVCSVMGKFLKKILFLFRIINNLFIYYVYIYIRPNDN